MSIVANSTNVTSQTSQPPRPPPIPLFLYRSQATITAQVIAFAILGIIILFGNMATIITFIKTQSLRKRSNYMLINLAVADFLIAFVVFLNCYYFSKLPMFQPVELRKVLEVLDVFTGTSSLLCLTLIAAERCFAIVFPFKHRVLRRWHYFCILPLPWAIAFVIILTLIVLDFPSQGKAYFRYLLFRYLVLFIGLVIMIFAYFVIWVRRPQNISRSSSRAYEKKLSVTLFIVTLASMVTWLPIQCFGFAFYVNNDLVGPHINYFVALKYIQFINSAINFLIYVLRIRDFKAGLIALLGFEHDINQPTNNSASTASSRRTSYKDVSTISLGLVTRQGSYDLAKEATGITGTTPKQIPQLLKIEQATL